jgi:hypothetical protein
MQSGRAQTPLLNIPAIAQREDESRWGSVRSGVKPRGNHAEETTCQGEDARHGRPRCPTSRAALAVLPSLGMLPHLRPSCPCVIPSYGRHTASGVQVRCQMHGSGLHVGADGSQRVRRGGEARVRLHSERRALRLRERVSSLGDSQRLREHASGWVRSPPYAQSTRTRQTADGIVPGARAPVMPARPACADVCVA